MHVTTPDHRTIKAAHLFCGLGGGARGFNRATARVGLLEANFRCLGGVDVDAATIRDFSRLSGVPGTYLDLFDREQYVAFHGGEPPPDWRAATTPALSFLLQGPRIRGLPSGAARDVLRKASERKDGNFQSGFGKNLQRTRNKPGAGFKPKTS